MTSQRIVPAARSASRSSTRTSTTKPSVRARVGTLPADAARSWKSGTGCGVRGGWTPGRRPGLVRLLFLGAVVVALRGVHIAQHRQHRIGHQRRLIEQAVEELGDEAVGVGAVEQRLDGRLPTRAGRGHVDVRATRTGRAAGPPGPLPPGGTISAAGLVGATASRAARSRSLIIPLAVTVPQRDVVPQPLRRDRRRPRCPATRRAPHRPAGCRARWAC